MDNVVASLLEHLGPGGLVPPQGGDALLGTSLLDSTVKENIHIYMLTSMKLNQTYTNQNNLVHKLPNKSPLKAS